MTKKYKLQISEPHIEDTETGECYDLSGKDNLIYLVELWNTRVDENKRLKSDLKYWKTLAQSLLKGNNIGEFEMMDKEVTIDLNEWGKGVYQDARFVHTAYRVLK